MLQIFDPGQIQARCVEGKMQVTEDASLVDPWHLYRVTIYEKCLPRENVDQSVPIASMIISSSHSLGEMALIVG